MIASNGKKLIIANRLREARKLAGLSQGQVANRLGLHRPTISEIEAGNRSVSAEELVQFGEIYKVSITWLTGLGAKKVAPQNDRLQIALRELNDLGPENINRLLTVLNVLREESERRRSDSSDFSITDSGPSAADNPSLNTSLQWTEELNARRCSLIDQKLQRGLSNDETVELERLQRAMRHYINQVAPLPFDAAKRLHAELLQRQKKK